MTRRSDASRHDVQSVAALAEPVRRRLYDVVVDGGQAIGREQAASLAGVPIHTAKFHLDKLVDEGLLEVEYRRLTGRTGPGSGRPAKLYRRVDREISVSLPVRQYDLLSRILANAIAEATSAGRPVTDVASGIAHAEGEALGRSQPDSDEPDLVRVRAALATTGYEPRCATTSVLELRNCPFHQTAAEQTELVCGLNLDFVTGVCDGLAATDARAALDPEPGRCCVVVTSSH